MPADLSGNQMIDWGNIFAMHNRDYTISLWTRPDGTTNTGYACGKTTGTNGFYFRRSASDASVWEWGHINGGTTHFAAAASSVSPGVAQNIILIYDTSDNDGFMYKNNSLIATQTTMTNQASTTAVLGVGNRGALDRDYDGLVWDFAVWLDVKLDSTERAKLAAGASALFCSTAPSLYAPLLSDTVEIIGPTTGTNTGSTTFTANTNIFFPPVHTRLYF